MNFVNKKFDTLCFIALKSEYSKPHPWELREQTKEELFSTRPSVSHSNVVCQFYQNKLISVLIYWSADLESLKSATANRFGNYYKCEIQNLYAGLNTVVGKHYVYKYKGLDSNIKILVSDSLKGGFHDGTKLGSKYYVVNTKPLRELFVALQNQEADKLKLQRAQNQKAVEQLKF